MSTPEPLPTPLIIVVMGVSGCGKSTVAQHIAGQLNAHCKDGDDLHPPANIDKMASGTPLDDNDRQPWLEDVAHYARKHAKTERVCVIACSALKRRYRHTINKAGSVVYVFLQGTLALIASRMHERTGHFMPETLLNSQFAALEDPSTEDNVVTVSIEADAPTIAANAIEAIHDLFRTRALAIDT